jgi:Protein of unknown function (DUF3352)
VRPMRSSLIAVSALLCLAIAGCGGSESGTTAGSAAADVAGIIPASAPLLLAFETDPDSDQWQQADELLSKFPGKQKLLDEVRKSAREDGVNLEQDFIPALGDETYLAFLDFENDGQNLVVLTKPRDEAKLKQLLQESDDPPMTREVDGWTVIAEEAATIDRVAAEGAKLDGAGWFEEAQARVEEDALVTLFANGGPLSEAATEQTIPGCDPPAQQGTLRYVAAVLLAEGDGVRFKVAAESEGAPEVEQGESLLSEVPAGAFAYLGSPGFDLAGLGFTEQIRCALESGGLEDIESELGVRFEQILDLFAGGFGIYTRPAALIPEVTLLLAPKDAAAGMRTLDTLAEKAGPLLDSTPRPQTVGGIEARELRLGPVSILFGADNNHIAITTARAGIEALAQGGDSLEDDEAFKNATDAAGVGDAEVYAYFDLRRLVDLGGDVAGFAGTDLPPDVRANLEPLRSFVAFGDLSDPNDVEVGAFLEIG